MGMAKPEKQQPGWKLQPPHRAEQHPPFAGEQAVEDKKKCRACMGKQELDASGSAIFSRILNCDPTCLLAEWHKNVCTFIYKTHIRLKKHRRHLPPAAKEESGHPQDQKQSPPRLRHDPVNHTSADSVKRVTPQALDWETWALAD